MTYTKLFTNDKRQKLKFIKEFEKSLINTNYRTRIIHVQDCVGIWPTSLVWVCYA